jgi:Flp pilus assembly pilin Flp
MALTCHWLMRCGKTIFPLQTSLEPRGLVYPFLDMQEEKRSSMAKLLQRLWKDEHGQDIAEYAVMLAVILVIVVGTIRLIGSNANNVFSQVGSAIQ